MQGNAKSKHLFLKRFVQSLRMLNVSLKELRLVAKNRGIKGYKSMSKSTSLNILNRPEPIKENKTIKDIRKENFNINEILTDIKPLPF